MTNDIIKEFDKIKDIIKKIADDGLFEEEKTIYKKIFSDDDGVKCIAAFGGKEYIIEKYISNPEPLDFYQVGLISFNMIVKSGNDVVDFSEYIPDDDIEKLFNYVRKKVKKIKRKQECLHPGCDLTSCQKEYLISRLL